MKARHASLFRLPLRPRAFSWAICAVLALGCGSKKEDGSANAAGTGDPAASAGKTEPKKPSVRTKLEPWRPLLAEAARAELEAGGLLIDFGTADQHKYTRGGWRTGWAANKSDGDKTSYVEGTDSRVKLDTWLRDEAVAEIVVRARSKVPGQEMTAYIDDTAVAKASVGTEWSLLRFPVKDGKVEPGLHQVLLRLHKEGQPRAEIDWMWFAREAGAEPAMTPRALPLKLGGEPKRALMATGARRYSFFLDVPPNASLVFDRGSKVGATFKVRAETDGGQVQELYSGTGTDAWVEEKVDLGALAGKAVRLELAVEGKDGLSGWAEPEVMIEPSEAPMGSAVNAKNAVVILIDTARADAFKSFYGQAVAETPAMDALAKESTVFEAAYAQENWTKPSVATVLTGTYPTTHDTKTDGAALPKEVELISEHLQAAGFATAGFIANGYVSDKFGFAKGWDTYKNYIRESKPSEAEFVYGDALEWLSKQQEKAPEQRFFLYLQTIDPHVVYRVDEPYWSKYFEGEYKGPLGNTIEAEEQIALGTGKMKHEQRDLDWLKALYFGEVSYHDEHLGTFLAELKTRGLLDDTVVVVTNDHGEELGDHGRYGHGHSLYEELIHAPMVWRFPKVFPPGKRVAEVAENVDLAPTVVDVLGLEPMKKADGLSMVPLMTGKDVQRPLYSVTEFLDGNRALRVGNYKLIRSAGNRVELYDLADDRGETKDLSSSHPVARRMTEVYLGEGLAAPDKRQRLQDIATKRSFQAGEADIDPMMRRQLEALGYFGD